MSLSKHCPELVSLNVGLVGRVTDVGVAALSRGCSSLQALNIAGAKEVGRTRPGNKVYRDNTAFFSWEKIVGVYAP